MRKFSLCSLAALGGLCVSAEASRPHPGQVAVDTRVATASPTRAAKVVRTGDGQWRLASNWFIPGQGTRDGQCSDGEAFDSFDIDWLADPNTPIIDPLGNQCGLPATSKYFLQWNPTTLYSNPNHIDDMVVDPAANGASSFEATWAFRVQAVTPSSWFLIETFDDVGDPTDCASGDPMDPNAPVHNFLGGIVLEYQNVPTGYIQFIAQLCGNPENISWTMPNGDGGMHMIYASDVQFDPDGNITQITLGTGQPMLWYNNNTTPPWTLTGTQTEIHYDDDGGVAAPPEMPDGMFDIGIECYNYTFALTCPGDGKMGTAITWLFGGGGTLPCAGDTDGDGDVDLQDLATLLGQFGTVAPGLSADFDNDGDVDLQDLASLLGAFGQPCP